MAKKDHEWFFKITSTVKAMAPDGTIYLQEIDPGWLTVDGQKAAEILSRGTFQTITAVSGNKSTPKPESE